jgi:DNA invertase Pin-like site-specific DNA recombinase
VEAIKKKLRRGDVLFVKSIDRLGRDYEEIQNQWRILTKNRGVDISVLDMPLLDTRNGRELVGVFIADMVLQTLCYVAQTERENICQRQAEGIKSAKLRGVQFGRPKKQDPENMSDILRRWQYKEISLQQAIEESGYGNHVILYRRLKEYKRDGKL